MKNLLITLVAILTFTAVPVSAQTYLTTTSLSAAVTSTTQDSVVVASATNVEAGGVLYVDHEAMPITAVSGTRVTVSRTQRPTTHASGATVIVVPRAAKSTVILAHESALSLAGSCTPSNHPYLPLIDAEYGDVYLCWAQGSTGFNTARIWHSTNSRSSNGTPSLLLNLQ